jgi:hypothetical protein
LGGRAESASARVVGFGPGFFGCLERTGFLFTGSSVEESEPVFDNVLWWMVESVDEIGEQEASRSRKIERE